jgi:hypothetical protein
MALTWLEVGVLVHPDCKAQAPAGQGTARFFRAGLA